MDKRKLGNVNQIASAYEIKFCGGKEDGKRGVLVRNGSLEVCLNASNALDVLWVSYGGVNMSFLSKNGLNGTCGDFAQKFEGGFLYTCGLDNVSNCVNGKPTHGSLHSRAAENVRIEREDGKITVSAQVRQSALFGCMLTLKRRYEICDNGITLTDTVINEAFTPAEYVLLYHANFGYPFLDEGLRIEMPAVKTLPLNDVAKERVNERLRIIPPVDGGAEDVYYNYLSRGEVTLLNERLGIKCEMLYSTQDFPVTVQWRSMVSGDYALGIEPSTTRFDEFSPRRLGVGEQKQYKSEYKFTKEQ